MSDSSHLMMKYPLLKIIFVLLASLTIATVNGTVLDGIPREENVLVLTKDNFEQATTGTTILVEFYAPWCGHCKALAPEYASAATQLAALQSSFLLAKVDAPAEAELAERFQISGYPTLKFFHKGDIIDYKGAKTAEAIINWLKKKTGPPAVELTSSEQAKRFKQSNQGVAIVGYFESAEAEQAKMYLELASAIDEYPFAVTYDEKVADALDMTAQGVVMYKNFDEGRVSMPTWTAENLKNFVQVNSLPAVIDFNQEIAERIFTGAIKNFNLLFVSYTSADYPRLLETYRSVASAYKGKVHFLAIDTDIEDHQMALEFFDLTMADVPVVRFIRTGKTEEEEMIKYKPNSGELSEKAIGEFVAGVLDGTIKPHLKSQELPEDWDQKPVKVLVASIFDEVTQDPSKDVLVEFYAPWCGHCKAFAPIYDELGEKFASVEGVLIAKMDATANELEHTKITNFPTIKLYKRGDTNEVIDYKGERTLEALTKFIETGGEFQEVSTASPEEVDRATEQDEKQKDEL